MATIQTIHEARRRGFLERTFVFEERETEVSHIFGPALLCPGGRLVDRDGTVRKFPDRWWQYNDGGRRAAGFYCHTGDCATRAIAIATGIPYKTVYDEIYALAVKMKDDSTPWLGVSREVLQSYIESLGWEWRPLMEIGSGCQVHLNAAELPDGRLIVKASKHLVAVIDGVIHDTHDCSRGGTRCVYGYFVQEKQIDK
ncbi:MAG: hypothetical protein KQH59_06450 [Desulfobulbaceae bacterium]|nr:hypothetical protein [Desulfobulbaceae bacterium]